MSSLSISTSNLRNCPYHTSWNTLYLCCRSIAISNGYWKRSRLPKSLNKFPDKFLYCHNIALNKIQGDWDKDKLAALLSDLDGSAFDVTLTGFDAAEVDEMLNEFYSQAAVQDDFDVDEEHEKIKAKGAVTKTGDIWKLGDHYLMCGDSTSESDFAKLMQGKRGQMAVTSPPYGVGKDYEKLGIEPWFETMRPVVVNLTKYAGIVAQRN